MMIRLILVRHGETEANLKHILQGHTEGELTDIGKHQTELLAHHMRNFQIDQIISSDLYRAQQTADIISAYLGVPVQFFSALREWNVGELDGKPAEALETAFQLANVPKAEYKPPGGESLLDLLNRAESFLNQVLEKYSNQVILVCSHGDYIRMLLAVILSKEVEKALAQPLGNTSYTIVDQFQNHEWTINKINNTSHLASVRSE